jgi:DNA-binding MarR family transcriptional regulator
MGVETDRTALELVILLAELGRAATDALRKNHSGVELVDNASLIVLAQIELFGPMRPIDLVELTGLTSGGITKVAARLEGAGLITRDKDTLPDDKRAVSIALTDKGHELMRAFAQELRIIVKDGKLVMKHLSQLNE